MEVHRSVTGFFHEVVTDALKAQQVETPASTEFYLVNLLAEFTAVGKVDEEPLALKMAQASGATPGERLRALKDVGDTSLYVSGFFADSLQRKLVDVDYYIALGGSAYGQLARSANGQSAFREAWGDLGSRFAKFVDVLHEVRAKTNFSGGSNLVRLYEEWVRTGSEWLERRLRATGLIAPEAFGGGPKSVS